MESGRERSGNYNISLIGDGRCVPGSESLTKSFKSSSEGDKSQSNVHLSALRMLASAARTPSPLTIDVPSPTRPKPSHLPTPLSTVREDSITCDVDFPLHKLCSRTSSNSPPQTPTTAFSSTTMLDNPAPNRHHPEARSMYDEIQNVLATFLTPGSKKELLLSSETRDTCVREASSSIHPHIVRIDHLLMKMTDILINET